MSEFQSHEFQSIDKALSSKERTLISSWSKRAEVSAYSAKFTYSYSDFQKDAKQVLLDYFDAYLYEANWGEKKLMFKFPKDLVSFSQLRGFDIIANGDYEAGLQVSKKNDFVVVSFHQQEEDGGGWIGEEYKLGDFMAVREEMLRGNNSFAFIFWLHQVILNQEMLGFEEDDDTIEHEGITEIALSSIPLELHKLSESCLKLMSFFEINPHLVPAVCKYLPQPTPKAKPNLEDQIKDMSEEEKNTFLIRLLKNEPNLHLKLEKRLTPPLQKTAINTTQKETFIKIEDIVKHL